MRTAIPDMLLPTAASFGKQRYRCAVIQSRGHDEVCTLRPSCGGLMGDGFAVRSFVHAFDPAVNRWREAQRLWGNTADMLCALPCFWNDPGPVPRQVCR
eukprot:9069698-Pyramimonas_sp.AAC.1